MTGATSDVDVMILDSHIYPFHDQLRSTSGSFATHLHNPGISSAEIWAHRTADNRPIFHGTHVAGAACGRGNDGNGTHGTAWGCRLHVFDAATGPNTVDFNLALWATTFQKLPGGAPKVVNMSMNQQRGSCAEAASGGFDPDGPEAKEWRKFFSAFPDTLFVIAAGNCGIPLRNANGNYPLLPASLAADDRSFFSNVIPVVNVDVTDETNWSLSNTTNHIVPRISLVLPETGIGAPGTAIWSTAHACDASGKNCQLGYAPQTGTSVAAAQISGIAALMKQLEPRASAIELQHCLQRSGEYQLVKRPKSGPQDNAVTALVDAQDALDCIRYTHSACQPPESANCAVFPQAYCEDSPEAGEICPAELPPKEIDTFYLGPAHQKRAWGCECLRLGCRPEAGSTFASHPETKASTWESMGCEKPN